MKKGTKRKAKIVQNGPKRKTLKELVAGITNQNRHEEMDWGYAVGKEIWWDENDDLYFKKLLGKVE